LVSIFPHNKTKGFNIVFGDVEIEIGENTGRATRARFDEP
jgi:hypothetical protein